MEFFLSIMAAVGLSAIWCGIAYGIARFLERFR